MELAWAAAQHYILMVGH